MSELYNITLTFTIGAESEDEAKRKMADIERAFMDGEGSWAVTEVAFHKAVYL